MSEPLVSIICITYNHEPYIRQCLDGFMMQRTNFSFEVLIHDDASTDNTVGIIREYEEKYPGIIKPIYQKENQYSKGVKIGMTYLYPRAKGKYIAECEGDDYWIDPLKLQKQVDILNSNEECSLVITNGRVLNSITGQIKKINPFGEFESGYVNIHDILQERYYLIPTASMCFRKEYIKMPSFFYESPVGDKPLRLWCALNGKVYYLSDVTVVYRFYSVSSFGLRISKDNHLAKNVYEKMITFYDKVNEYSLYKYNADIQLLKDKEEYFYYRRIGNRKQVIKSRYFSQLPIVIRIRFVLKTIMIRLRDALSI